MCGESDSTSRAFSGLLAGYWSEQKTEAWLGDAEVGVQRRRLEVVECQSQEIPKLLSCD